MMNKKPPQSEPEIDLQRLRRRDREEVDRWFDTYSDPLYGFIFYRVGRDADLAGDMAQETFVTALETIDRFDPDRGEMFPWLTHLARNCIRKVLRRRGKDGALSDFWKTVDRVSCPRQQKAWSRIFFPRNFSSRRRPPNWYAWP